jgi:iron-sulfur cluster repair protein YtfE (RIC family)
MEQHAQVRARLQDWEMALERLSTDGSRVVARQAADASLREILDYFKTVMTTHCRQEESELFPAFRRNAEVAAKLAAFRAEHERFGVDLDKFERQMVSYGLSKDPTVLLTLGTRMIREMRGHLEAEEQLLPLSRLRAIRKSSVH